MAETIQHNDSQKVLKFQTRYSEQINKFEKKRTRRITCISRRLMFREVWSPSKVKDGKHIDRILRSGDKKNEKGEIQ